MLSITIATATVIGKKIAQIEGKTVILYDEVDNCLQATIAKMKTTNYRMRPVSWKNYLKSKTSPLRRFQVGYKFIIFIKITAFARIIVIITGFIARIVITKKHMNLGHNWRRMEQNRV